MVVLQTWWTVVLVVAFVGHERSKVFRRHMDQVDDYLADLRENRKLRSNARVRHLDNGVVRHALSH